jgi:hypothetical protein
VAACPECGAALAADQRYCLGCGARIGPRPPALERILADLRPGDPAPDAWASAVRGRRGVLPGPLASAALTLAMLAFGGVVGAFASPSGVVRRGPLTMVLAARASTSTPLASTPPPAEASPTPEPPGGPSASEPPSGESSEQSSPSSEEHTKSSSGSGGSSGNRGSSGTRGSGGAGRSGGSAGGRSSTLPPVKHVFLIVLADQPYAQTFGPESPAPYLSRTLERRGELLPRFYAVAHEELADEIALVSGLGPTPATAADCPTFTDIVPAVASKDGQYGGEGCIYPPAAQTVGDQLAAKGLSWRVYAEAPSAAGQPAAAGGCVHPAFGAADPTSAAPSGDTVATFRDPFVYFDGVLHSPACAREIVGLSRLAGNLHSAKRTPSLSYIVPGLCRDGRPSPCTPGAPGGLPAADTFLRRVVPEILASPAYRHGGLLVITTDMAPAAGVYGDSSSCCFQPRFPAPLPAQPAAGAQTTTTAPPAAGLPPSGGGQVGALLLSPYVKPGTSDQEPFNDFSLLRTIENLFGLPRLGYAAKPGVGALESSVFSAYSGG